MPAEGSVTEHPRPAVEAEASAAGRGPSRYATSEGRGRDPHYPEYQGDTDQTQQTRLQQQLRDERRLIDDWPDKVYFILAGLASIWLAVVALTQAVHMSWWSVLFILIFWGLAAYLTLPRFHRIMTTIYVPDYFLGRTQTGDGLLGDPVNLAFLAEEDDIHEAMRRAGWTMAEPVTLKSSWRIVISSLTKRSYPSAPVSPLLLFGRRQDFAYQQEVDGNPSKRHHVRFWKTPEGWMLPGGQRADWVAAATYDNAVGLSLFTLQVTHKVDAATDLERDYVVQTLSYTSPEASVRVLEGFMSGYNSRNGGGDQIRTDGNLPIVDLDEVAPGDHEEDSGQQARGPHGHRNLSQLAEKAPPQVWMAGALVSLVALLQMGRSLYRLFTPEFARSVRDERLIDAAEAFAADTGSDLWDVTLALVTAAIAVIALVQVLLAINVVRGRYRARQISLALLLVSFVATAVEVFNGTADSSITYAVFVVMASQVFAMIEYTSDDAINYTWAARQTLRQRKAQKRKDRRAARRAARGGSSDRG